MRIASSLAIFALLSMGAQVNAQEMGVIVVWGRGVVEVAPDHAVVSIGVINKRPTPADALDGNSASSRRVIDFLKANGIEERDIRTLAVSLSGDVRMRRDAQGNATQENDGYIATNTVEARLRQIGKLGVILRDALDHGANRITGVRFGIENSEVVQDNARTRAVADATRKAKLLAQAAGLQLGTIVRIESPPRQQTSSSDAAADLPIRRAAPRASVPIEAGMIEITADVDVVWRLSP